MRPFSVNVPRKNEKTGKTYWTRIGSAFKRDDGGMKVVLDALPIGNEFLIFPPKDDDRQQGNRQREPGEDDDVPY